MKTMDVKYEALKLLKQLFTKQNFADARLVDGTIVSADTFEPGQDLFVLDEAGERLPAPDGEHILEDGTCVYVTGGKIDSIVKSENSEAEINEQVAIQEEDMAIEVEVEPYVEEVPEKEDEIAILKAMIDEVMGKVKMMEEEMGKMKMSSQETSQTIADAVVELSENFSKIPGAEKLDVNPTEIENKFSKTTKTQKKQSIHEWIANQKKS
jgi:hypothetical protein